MNRLKLSLERDFPVEPIEERILENYMDEIVNNRRATKQIIKVARSEKLTLEDAIREKCGDYLSKMIGFENPGLINKLRNKFAWYLNGMFDKISIDEANIEKIKRCQKEGSVLFLPPHYSHLDYVIKTWVFDKYEIKQPYIAAGSNVWFSKLKIVDWFFRSFRGFPIDRKKTKKEDILYLATVKEFTKEILNQNFSLLIYLDGSRRKEGYPNCHLKTGGLKAAIEYQKENPQKRIFIAPVIMTYERVPEDYKFVKETSGEKNHKTPHLANFVYLPFPRNKCGEFSIKFHEPYLLNDYIKNDGGKSDSILAKNLAENVISKIENSKEITNTQKIAIDILDYMKEHGEDVPITYLVEKRGGDNVNRAGRFFEINGAINKGAFLWHIKNEKLLEFYKNQAINKYRTQTL